jgi:hypothetical protein
MLDAQHRIGSALPLYVHACSGACCCQGNGNGIQTLMWNQTHGGEVTLTNTNVYANTGNSEVFLLSEPSRTPIFHCPAVEGHLLASYLCCRVLGFG